MGRSFFLASAALMVASFMVAPIANANKKSKLPDISPAQCAQPHTDNDVCPNLDLLLTKADQKNKNTGAQFLAPADPAMKKLFLRVMKSHSCMAMINYHASRLRLSDMVVTAGTRVMNGGLEERFSNNVHADICGTVRLYYLPMGVNCRAAQDAKDKMFIAQVEHLYLNFVGLIHSKFTDAEIDLSFEADARTQSYLPEGKGFEKPPALDVSEYIERFSYRVIESYRSVIANSGLSPAEADHFTSLLKCSVLLPEASGPDMRAFSNYPDAFEDYKRFERDLDEAVK